MRLAAITKDSVTEGPGLRMVLWTQGCCHHCTGCHNPETWNPSGGYEESIDSIIAQALAYRGDITFCGGEPLDQLTELIPICSVLKDKKNIWCYTGYTIEEILQDSLKESVLKYIDVLVEGRYKQELRTDECLFRGSSNQRLIDCKRTLEEGYPVLYE